MANNQVSDLGLRRVGKHPASVHSTHHDCAMQSSMTGIRTTVSDKENGRPQATAARARHAIVRSSSDGGRDMNGDAGL